MSAFLVANIAPVGSDLMVVTEQKRSGYDDKGSQCDGNKDDHRIAMLFVSTLFV